MYYFKAVTVNPKVPERISRLQELAYNLWFSWNPQSTLLFSKINADLWEHVYHNPVKFLIYVQQQDLDRAAGDEQYLQAYDQVFTDYDRYMNEEKWFQKQYPHHNGQPIAYFSAEFGLHESLPIYSGGLGLLAGDHCKAASDLGLSFVAVGLLYKHGYFSQSLNNEGWQQAEYPSLNFAEMPIRPVLDEEGKEVIIPLDFPNRTVFVKIWWIKVGTIAVYLLDADIQLNSAEDRMLTGQLYGGDTEMRISQEIILGIGGVRALRALNIHPSAWHINEGHAAFLCCERVREHVRKGIPLATAKESVRAGTLFTTHTPVPAGHDKFNSDMVERYLQHIYGEMGMSQDDFMKLGSDGKSSRFNMTMLAMNLSSYTNGVSKLHGLVTRKMFKDQYKSIPTEEMPISSVTNGVHTKTWLAPALAKLFNDYIGPDWDKDIANQEIWQRAQDIPEEELWKLHRALKEKNIKYVRENLKKQRRRNMESIKRIKEVDEYLDPDVLTIGFARRFATYKRASILFSDRERLVRLLNNPERPVQMIFAGKAHPADEPGKELIKLIYDASNEEEFKGKIIFLENYDINMARHLVQGVDVWLNTPRWPMEASGTSGMKAGLNGILNCSILDGWWPEGYNGKNGFAIGEQKEYSSTEEQDRDDALHLYSLLEDEIVPCYYSGEGKWSPDWMAKIKECLMSITWKFSTERMVKDYTNNFYANCLSRRIEFQNNNYELASHINGFKRFLLENWHQVMIQSVTTNCQESMFVGDQLQLEAQIKLGPIAHHDVVVEIVYGQEEGVSLSGVQSVAMEHQSQGEHGIHVFKGKLKVKQGTMGYTVRIRPHSQHFAHKFELNLVTWAPNF